MQTIREQKVISPNSFPSGFPVSPVSQPEVKRLKIKEFTSWAVCFAAVTGLTGTMKIMKVGITMDTVNSVLFFLSLSGLGFFIYRIIAISKTPAGLNRSDLHKLN